MSDLTVPMRRELRSIATTGEPSDPAEYHGAGVLWFHARDRVLSALMRRDLITSSVGGFELTSAGREIMQPTLDAAAAKAAPRRFTGEPPTGFGGL